MLALDPVSRELWQVNAVDLRHPHVHRAVGIAPKRPGPQIGLYLQHRTQQARVNAVVLRRRWDAALGGLHGMRRRNAGVHLGLGADPKTSHSASQDKKPTGRYF